VKSRPAILHNNRPRSDQKEQFLLLIVKTASQIHPRLGATSDQQIGRHLAILDTLRDFPDLISLGRAYEGPAVF
jgi:hypothetical protein